MTEAAEPPVKLPPLTLSRPGTVTVNVPAEPVTVTSAAFTPSSTATIADFTAEAAAS